MGEKPLWTKFDPSKTKFDPFEFTTLAVTLRSKKSLGFTSNFNFATKILKSLAKYG